MLAQPFRLRRPRDITRVLGRGRFGSGPDLHLKSAPNHLATNRVAVVVSRKASRKAVDRNRARRRIAANLAELWPKLHPGYDIVVVARNDLAAQTPTALQRQLEGALRKTGLLE